MTQFKVRDWVRHDEGITRISGFIEKSSENREGIWLSEEYSDGRLIPLSDCELWQPKEGEWCWFYNNIDEYQTLGFAKFSKIVDGKYEGIGIDCYRLTTMCEPFIGQLPSLIKE